MKALYIISLVFSILNFDAQLRDNGFAAASGWLCATLWLILIIFKYEERILMDDFKKLVYAMRSAQKAYFKAPYGTDAKKLALEMSKELEKKVDAALNEPADQNQIKMF